MQQLHLKLICIPNIDTFFFTWLQNISLKGKARAILRETVAAYTTIVYTIVYTVL